MYKEIYWWYIIDQDYKLIGVHKLKTWYVFIFNIHHLNKS